MKKKITVRPITPPIRRAKENEIYITVESYIVRQERAEEEYGDWYTEESNSIKRITKAKPTTWDFYARDVSNKIFNAKKIYIVAVTYSSGDTFGRCEGKLDIYKIFSKKKEAEALADRINKEEKNFDVGPTDPYPEWIGYFESISHVEVLEFEYE